MTTPDIDGVLRGAERSVDRGDGLGGTGFWPLVAQVKADPELVERYAEKIAEIDRSAFESWALVKVPVGLGTVLMSLATLVGVALIGSAYFVEPELWKTIVFYVGFGILLTTTHGLAHLVVGTAGGMGFSHWFIGTIGRPQPGVKLDYSTYLRSPARSRAWMHASGAIMTKAMPFLLIGAAIAADLPLGAIWALPVIGVVTIVTDVVWSTKSSDWKKYRREMEFAQES